MKVHMMTGGTGLRDFVRLASEAADAGFAGLVITESGRTAYLSAAVAAIQDLDLDLATGVAVAFPRSPMVTAATAWELAQATGGRFRLGLGTQVRAHIERRYSTSFDRPGPRLREYVEAVQACFAGFRGARLDHHGDFYDLSLLPAMWSPGPIDVPDPPVDLAAVNPWMLRMTGAVADGVHVHPLNSPTYHAETLMPNVEAGRGSLAGFTAFVPVFTAAGDTAEERSKWRETTRTMVGFYGSTPNYAFVFEQIGHPGTTEALRAAQKTGDMAGMSAVITDDIVDHFMVEGPWGEMPDRITDRMAPLVARGLDVQPVLYHAGMTYRRDEPTFRRFGELAAALRDR
ncbi:MAG: TIGR03617 family F420-dependent LLM class oxidoreductase [Acidimicrobiia bacterium]